ncbi:hypothetical protein Tco_0300776 [Tanacetum coccineum]
MSSPNHSTSDIEDAFSSMNILNYTSISLDYFPASSGSISFNSSEDSNIIPSCASFLLVKLAMTPFAPKKFRMGVAITTGRRGYYKPGTRAWVSRISRKIRIPISMYPCRVEERLTIELAEGREVEKIVTTVTKNGVVTRYPGKFQEYQLTDKEKEMERMMIYWDQVEYEVSDDDDSDLKSTARSVPKDYELEDTGDSSRN